MTAALRMALAELLDDYIGEHGPDGYPQPMPQAWRVVQAWLTFEPREAPALDVERLARAMRWCQRQQWPNGWFAPELARAYEAELHIDTEPDGRP